MDYSIMVRVHSFHFLAKVSLSFLRRLLLSAMGRGSCQGEFASVFHGSKV